MKSEEWQPIPEWEGVYEASSMGRVRSVDRIICARNGAQWRHQGKVLKPHLTSGRLGISLQCGGRPVNRYVHALVCAAFHGPRPFPSAQVRHLNGDEFDNTPENLRWGTRSENMQDRVRHGTDPHSSRTHCLRGHPYDEENTYWRPRASGGRDCKKCRSASKRKAALKGRDQHWHPDVPRPIEETA